ncbi:MAG: T9SS type A sorting domain-containing protein [Saprospiraceae bacterium]|nr:T9SS type A sorting domain-containing protein [Saprospiraceae bacterium]
MQQGSNTYTPSIAGTYYAESRNTINGCKSNTRIPVSLIIRAVPTLSLTTTTCSADLASYSINFSSNGTVSSTTGIVNNTTKTISNIPTGTNITLTSSSNGCSTSLNVTAPSCTCPSITAPTSGGNQTICSNESIPNLSANATGINETIDWYDSSTSGNLLQQGSSTYRPSIAGTYFAESRNTINGCKSSTRTPMSLIILAVPTLSIITTTCSADLASYSINFSSNGTVSSSSGIVNNTTKTISGIPSGTNVTLSSSLNGCTTTLNVTAPSCTCPSITAPTSGGNQTICSNESIPNLSANATGINETIDWYDSSTSDNLLQQGSSTYRPSIAGTYFAESRNTINGCKSSTRTPMSLIILAVPTLSIITTTCSADLTTYSINFSSNGTVSSSSGIVNNTTKTISGIPSGTNVTLSSSLNGCTTTLNVTAPSCTCPSITAPTSGGNQSICSNESIPNLSATATGINETIDWYDSSTGGNLLQQGSNTYTPSIAGTYYAESRNTINGCKSSTRTPVSLVIRAVPTLNLTTTTCSADLTTYSINFSSNGTVSSTSGNVNNTTKTISGIPSGINVTLTSSLNGCTTTLIVTAPSCTCPSLSAPITGGNQTTCSNESTPNLSANATGINETIDWYDSSTGGNLLQQGSNTYTPSIAGTYYAESRNTINGCKSSTRTPVSLIIRAVPTLSLTTITCSADLTTYTISFASNGTVSSTTGSVNNTTKTISSIPSGTNVKLSSSLNGCTTTLNVTAPSCTCPSITAPTSGGNQTICSNESIPNLSTTATGINETIDWYDSSTGGNLLQQGSNTYTPSIAGTYYAESRNTINGCKSNTRIPVSLIIHTIPILRMTATTCSADQATYTIAYESNGLVSSSSGTVHTITKLVSGILIGTEVTLTASLNGCATDLIVGSPNCIADTNTIKITSMVSPVSCFGQKNGSIGLVVHGGKAPYSYEWQDLPKGGNLNFRTGLSAGTYLIKVSDQNMNQADAQITVTEPAILQLNKIDASPGCQANNGMIQITPRGGTAPYTYAWSDLIEQKESGRRIQLSAGYYEVIVTDSAGCRAGLSVPLYTQPGDGIAVHTEDIGCENKAAGKIQLTFDADHIPSKILWSDFKEQNRASRSNLPPGDYSAITIDGDGCSYLFDSIQIKNKKPITLQDINIKAPSCYGISDAGIRLVVNSSDPGIQFKWSNGSRDKDIVNLQAGSYTLRIFGDQHCTTDTVIVVPEGNPLLSPRIELSDSVLTCKDQEVLVQLPDSFTYDWIGPNHFTSISNSVALKSAGKYWVTLENHLGCIARDSIFVGESKEVFKASFILPSEGVLNQPVIASEISWPIPDSIHWVYDGATTSWTGNDQNQYRFAFSGTGIFSIKMIAYKYGCSSEIIKTIKIVGDAALLTTPDPVTPIRNIRSIKLFPNPNAGDFAAVISLNSPGAMQIRVYDLFGKIWHSRLIQGQADYSESFNLTELTNGVYSMTFLQGIEYLVLHFIVSK